jgi:hypothetical protein
MNQAQLKKALATADRRNEALRKELIAARGEVQDRKAVERLLRNQLADLSGLSEDEITKFVEGCRQLWSA